MNNKHQSEAASVGLTLLSETPPIRNGVEDFNYKLYKFNSCGHEQYLQPTHVRRNNVKCSVCFEEDIRKTAQERGFTVLGEGTSALFRKVRRDICGHISEVRHAAIKKRSEANEDLNFTCEQCYEIRLKEEAEAAGMTYLGKALHKAGSFRHYKFNKCGHVRDIHAPCISIGNFFCSECKEEKYKAEAANAGLTYIGFGTNRSDCKRMYVLPCGHTKEIRMDHARDGSYLCNTCGDSHYTKPSSIYLLKITTEDSFTWLKLGFARNLAVRKSNYGLPKGANVELLAVVDVPTGAMAVSKEKSWHKVMKSFRLDSTFMKNYHKFNGFTECYSVEAEDQILTLIRDLEKELNE